MKDTLKKKKKIDTVEIEEEEWTYSRWHNESSQNPKLKHIEEWNDFWQLELHRYQMNDAQRKQQNKFPTSASNTRHTDQWKDQKRDGKTK